MPNGLSPATFDSCTYNHLQFVAKILDTSLHIYPPPPQIKIKINKQNLKHLDQETAVCPTVYPLSTHIICKC